MDIDMHYYGTCALARAAGLRIDVAHRIATAAEFVDDSTDTEILVNPQGARFRGESTAHHPTDFGPNNDHDDQLMVWLPFHFLPGAEGENQSQRLVCRKNSPIARTMVDHHLAHADGTFAPELMGITAHVYADTFAHYGFSGVSSRLNRVLGTSIELKNGDPLTGALTRFMGKFGLQGGLQKNFRQMITDLAATVAEDTTGALGHGAVATFPDQPYLEWSYSYECGDLVQKPIKIERQNANDYMEAAEVLYNMFRTFAEQREEYRDKHGPVDFDAIRGVVRGIVTKAVDRDARVALWQSAVTAGKLGKVTDVIPAYDHREWQFQTNQLRTIEKPEEASSIPVYHFHQAAALHKYYVLRDLLPANGIYVV